jgi:hypothetical protein
MTNSEINKIENLISKLEEFLAGKNSLRFANEIESDFIDLFYEDDEIFNVAEALAAYRPEGGDFLYDKEAIKPTCNHLIKLLKLKLQAQ